MNALQILNLMAQKGCLPTDQRILNELDVRWSQGALVRRFANAAESMGYLHDARDIRADDFKNEVTLDEARRVFDALAAQDVFTKIDLEDGQCHRATHLMCAAIADMGIVPLKAWLISLDKEKHLTIHGLPVSPLNWAFHVAPALAVRMPDGRKRHLVIDPALFDAPATLTQWASLTSGRHKKITVTPYAHVPHMPNAEECRPALLPSPHADELAEECMAIKKNSLRACMRRAGLRL